MISRKKNSHSECGRHFLHTGGSLMPMQVDAGFVASAIKSFRKLQMELCSLILTRPVMGLTLQMLVRMMILFQLATSQMSLRHQSVNVPFPSSTPQVERAERKPSGTPHPP
eukprot:2767330-Karenia_brevis.AAC.1